MQDDTAPVARRRRWLIVAPLAFVVLIAVAWSAVWYVAVQRAEQAMTVWRAREAQSGREYVCGKEAIGGYPFRIEVTCDDAGAILRNPLSVTTLKLRDIRVVAQIWDPTLLVAEFNAPMSLAEGTQPPTFGAAWRLGLASVRGTPGAPERISMVIDAPTIVRVDGTTQQTILSADRAEMHGRLAQGTLTSDPVIELAMTLGGGLAQSWHPLLGSPLDADLQVTLRGLTDFAPKPWPVRLRELQARAGRLDVTRIRLDQGDITAQGAGSLTLSPRGGLEGELQVTVAGLDKVLRTLQIDPSAAQPGQAGQIGNALGALDRIMPGLGNLARQQAAPILSAGMAFLGRQTKLDGRDAVSLPLRFSDGAAFLGPIPVGRVPPLF